MLETARTVLITGATDGLGYEIARRLAAEDYNVIVHARTAERGEEAIERLVKSGAEPLRLQLAVADFSSLAEVATMARQIPRLDVLVNNAGIAGGDRRVLTEDGHELTFQVNYLAHYLLTVMLEQPLAEARHARVVNVSSALHRAANIDWTDLNRSHRYSRGAVYAQSKLALTMFTSALPEFGPIGMTAVSVHPGILATNLLDGPRTGRPASEGAETPARLCASSTPVLNGGYYDEQLHLAHPSAAVQNRRSVEWLWKLSAKLTGVR
jgi:NAD(P)-dependent dehydrogenase (short-subunit alcohol dehydrogenase family)